jgi:DnaJ-domain-containing protein 1
MTKNLFFLIAALLYVLFPRDVVPDFLIGWGWLDDLAVIYLLWRYYRRQLQMRRSGSRANQTRQTTDDRQSRAADADGRSRRDHYTVLEIAPGATKEEIKSAYRRLAAQYHPDKVQHLGEEFQVLAEARFKEIQKAYEELISR